MRRPLRLAASALALSVPRIASACLPPEPPSPPPRTAAESKAAFVARSEKWYADLAEAERVASLPGRIADEKKLWAAAGRVVVARVTKAGSIRLRGSEGQYYKSPFATLRAVRWLKGNSSPRRLKAHYLSDNSCDFGGVGGAPEGRVGELYLLFYRSGAIEPRNLLYTYRSDEVVTERSAAAFGRRQER